MVTMLFILLVFTNILMTCYLIAYSVDNHRYLTVMVNRGRLMFSRGGVCYAAVCVCVCRVRVQQAFGEAQGVNPLYLWHEGQPPCGEVVEHVCAVGFAEVGRGPCCSETHKES